MGFKYYKDENSTVFAFEDDGSQDDYIGGHLMPITQAEADAIRNPPLTPEQELAQAKSARAAEVAAIKVTTGGVTYDGDETAQGRMARAALAMNDTDTLPWVAADNSIVTVNKAELLEVLRLAGAAMAAIWVRPYQ